jgi:hypothetical protein
LLLRCLTDIAARPLKSLELIDSFNLYNHIFTLSPRDSSKESGSAKKSSPAIEGCLDPPHPPCESVAAGRLVEYLLQHRIAEFLQLDAVSPIPWLMAGLAPWRGIMHSHPPKKQPKFCASLITKHELMYGEDIRDVVEDTFEKRKMETVKNGVQRNAIQQLSKQDAGIALLSF